VSFAWLILVRITNGSSIFITISGWEEIAQSLSPGSMPTLATPFTALGECQQWMPSECVLSADVFGNQESITLGARRECRVMPLAHHQWTTEYRPGKKIYQSEHQG